MEEDLRERANQQTIALLKQNKDDEWKRNRRAILDIRGIYNDHIKAMETFKLEMNEDEGRDDEYWKETRYNYATHTNILRWPGITPWH